MARYEPRQSDTYRTCAPSVNPWSHIANRLARLVSKRVEKAASPIWNHKTIPEGIEVVMGSGQRDRRYRSNQNACTNRPVTMDLVGNTQPSGEQQGNQRDGQGHHDRKCLQELRERAHGNPSDLPARTRRAPPVRQQSCLDDVLLAYRPRFHRSPGWVANSCKPPAQPLPPLLSS